MKYKSYSNEEIKKILESLDEKKDNEKEDKIEVEENKDNKE
jgi:hypothetical protein